MNAEMPTSRHRFCLQHICRNIGTRRGAKRIAFGDLERRPVFRLAKAPRLVDFNARLTLLRDNNAGTTLSYYILTQYFNNIITIMFTLNMSAKL